MAQYSVYRVIFHIENTSGKNISGPHSAAIGISGGSQSDLHSQSVGDSLRTAISNNLAAITGSAPAGTVVIDSTSHGSVGTALYV